MNTTNKPLIECADLPAGHFGGTETFTAKIIFPEGCLIPVNNGGVALVINGNPIELTKTDASKALQNMLTPTTESCDTPIINKPQDHIDKKEDETYTDSYDRAMSSIL